MRMTRPRPSHDFTHSFMERANLRKQQHLVGAPTHPLKVQVVTSAILSFAPWLELHHIVVLTDPNCASKGVYTVDFSPLDYADPKTLAKLLLGQDVPGEIRVRWISADKLNMNEIKDNCMFSDNSFFEDVRFDHHGEGHQRYSKNPAVEEFLHTIKHSWRERINLYLHNCQHFSYYVKRMAAQEFKLIDHDK